jgi:glycerol-3-phosphate acyltransferase PlsY
VTAILLSLLGGYFLGSVPFGLIAGKIHGVDIREHGSRNIGATNVWRVFGWKLGLPVFLLDAGKGVGAVWLGRLAASSFAGPLDWCMVIAGMACILGHSFPVWLRFKGGKGVATSLGAIIAMLPMVSAIIFGIWAVIFAVSRYVSLASIIAAAAFPVVAFLFHATPPVLGFAVVSATLVIVLHRGNIQRLRSGTERRFGGKKEVPS